MRNYLLITLLSSLLLVSSLHAGKKMTPAAQKILSDAKKSIKHISPKDFKKMIDDDEVEFVLLDVRENNQYGHGEIWTMNTVKLTRGYVEYKVEHAIEDKKAKIIVVCCSGNRAVLTAQTLKKLGYKDVSYLDGGVFNWMESGYPLDTVFGELYLKK